MAVIRKENNQVQNNEARYNGMQGVSNRTAQQMNNYTSYQPGQAATQAQNRLQEVQAMKPASYNSKYGAALDNILKQIQTPNDVTYEFNGDNLFKAYKDLYTQQGRQASMDAMGQAAALTGGYGNSYAQQVGNQAYDQYLLSLYDKGMDLYDRAYQANQDKRADLYNQYGTLSAQDQTEYGRNQDELQNWRDELEYYTGRADRAENTDRANWESDRAYWTDLANAENADYWKTENFLEDQRRYDQDYDRAVLESDRNFNEDVRRNNRDYDRGVLESDRAFDEDVRRNNRDYDRAVYEYDTSLAEDKRQFDAKLAQDQAQFEATMAENQRQFIASLDWDKMSSDQKYAAEYAMQILANGQMPTAEMLEAAGLSAENAQKLLAQLVPAGGGGSGSGSGSSSKIYEDAGGAYYTYDNKGNVQLVDTKTIDPNTPIYGTEYNLNKGTNAGKNIMLGSVQAGVDAGKKNITADMTAAARAAEEEARKRAQAAANKGIYKN